MTITQDLLDKLFEEAKKNPRQRTNLDLRTSAEDGSQRMLNAMLPGTVVAIHRHPMSNENVILIKGRLERCYMRKSFLLMVRLRLGSLSAYTYAHRMVPTDAKYQKVCGIR